MLENIKYNQFIKKMNKLVTDEKFLKKLQQLIFNMETNCSNCKINYNKSRFSEYIIWTGKINNQEQDLKIIIDKNAVVFSYCIDNENINEFGEFYKTKKNTIVKYFGSKITNENELKKLEKQKEISVFYNNIENFRYIENNYQKYKIKNGVKILLPRNQSYFCNVFHIFKLKRTKSNKLIMIRESKYYDNNLNQYNNVDYYIDEETCQNEKYLKNSGNFKQISKTKYLDLINSISEKKQHIKK